MSAESWGGSEIVFMVGLLPLKGRGREKRVIWKLEGVLWRELRYGAGIKLLSEKVSCRGRLE